MDFLKDIVKEIGDDFTQLAADIDGEEKYIDTGSYIFNSLLSGSIFGGVSRNKITAIAGESSTGKTFFSLAVVKNFLDSNPDGYCLYFDTEAAVNKSLLADRGLDLDRVVVVNVVTIEEFRSKALKAVDPQVHQKNYGHRPVQMNNFQQKNYGLHRAPGRSSVKDLNRILHISGELESLARE